MKKATKTTKSAPAPAPAPTPKTTKKAAPAPAPAPAPKKVAAKKPAAPKAAPAPKPAPAPAPVPVAAPAALPTTIVARIDIGFGNTLYVRGQGPGLGWESGMPMECTADDCWTLTLHGLTDTTPFKVLVNDVTWSVGPDYIAAPGVTIEISPTFE